MYEIKKAAQDDIELVLDMRYATVKAVCHLGDSYVFDNDGRLLYEKMGFRPSGEGMVLEI